jgi:twinkle protein
MTMSNEILAWLSSRGIDAELADKLGLASVRRDGGECVVLPFKRDGETVRRKYRQLQGDAKWSQDKGGLRIAYNEDCLRRDDLLGQALIITEGEFDAIAAIQSGFERTISVPDGAPPPGERAKADLEGGSKYAWLQDVRPFLTVERAPEIIIAADGDENGAALLQDLSVLLGRPRCKFLTYPKSRADRGRERCKDLNEVLEDYGQKGVVETLARAQYLPVSGVYRMSELPPSPPMTIYHPRHKLLSENFRVRLGDFSVITGTPGFGKSSFANDVFCGIAQDHGVKVAWASFEQEPQRDHRRALRSWFIGAAEWRASDEERRAADAWIDQHHLFIVPQEDEDPTFDWLLDAMELAVIRHDARIIVIDPWNEVEHCRARDETETEYIGRAIRTLKRFARRMKVHICVVAHPTKSVKDGEGNYKMPTLYDIAGSAAWYNKCDLGLIVHREDEDNTIIKVQKSRYHEILGTPGEVRVQYSKDARYFAEIERVA